MNWGEAGFLKCKGKIVISLSFFFFFFLFFFFKGEDSREKNWAFKGEDSRQNCHFTLINWVIRI
jgi:hypothetical protein